MIVCSKLGHLGRLGNQLWELASTAGIAATLGETRGFPDWDYRPYFSVPDRVFPAELKGTEAADTGLVSHIDERARGYLQDYGLFRHIEEDIRKWFQPSGLALSILHEEGHLWLTEMPRPILSVHVRRGDNVPGADPGVKHKERYHPLRPLSYYTQAIEMLEGEFNSIVVFSDDPDWCRQAFNLYEKEYEVGYFEGVPRTKEHLPEYKTEPVLDWIDLFVMTYCDRHIIGNSTYAWWGAFLSADPSPIYPSPWFGPMLDYIDASLMFPPNWVKVSHADRL
jgi:hypothetical protein